MKYIRKRKEITTICNEEVMDVEIILEILNGLKNENNVFSVILYKKRVSSHSSSSTDRYPEVRVSHIYEDSVDLLVYKAKIWMKLAGVRISDIIEIESVSTFEQELRATEEVGRWGLLDIDGEVENE